MILYRQTKNDTLYDTSYFSVSNLSIKYKYELKNIFRYHASIYVPLDEYRGFRSHFYI